MPRDIRDRRGGTRQKIPKAITVQVEVQTPDGRRQRFPVLDISLNDCCFVLPPGAPQIQSGTDLANAVIRAGNFTVECHLSVLRTWRELDQSYQCGARLYPKGESDQNELVSLVSALAATRPGETSE